jgi:NAD(P)-dependent dehydrogenase (short-subunit alcohol dehydrogenase family)
MSVRPKTALITGATDGIGLHTAQLLVNQKVCTRLIIHGRDAERLRQAKSQILRGQTEDSTVVPILADFRSLDEVKGMCDTIKQENPGGLDLIINNAGVYAPEYSQTVDGFEETYQVNVLASHIVTSLLHPLVTRGKIIHVASISASSSVDFGRYRNPVPASSYSSHRAYSESKLLNIMQASAYSRALNSGNEERILVQSLDPGTVNTKMLLSGWGRIGIEVDSADNQFLLASRGDVNGGYFVSDRLSRYPSPLCSDDESLADLIEMLCQHTGMSNTALPLWK